MPTVHASWFIVYVGIAVAGIAAPANGKTGMTAGVFLCKKNISQRNAGFYYRKAAMRDRTRNTAAMANSSLQTLPRRFSISYSGRLPSWDFPGP